ncbi:MAG: TIGR00341 family protein [Ferruginibacter sp.]
MDNFFNKFRLHAEKEELQVIIQNIDNGVAFRGTNLWVLIFAIFVASLGLNVNSTAVIIGAMLISPLMGPIMGLGLGTGINDLGLLKKAINNYLVATGVALVTSTIFFLLSPLNEAHSEILSRTSPTVYDVLIALFGGFAGILAVSSRQKGNVIPGVAIATALMPPLCTAGFGLATWQLHLFIGAFYLYIINTVFIALATFITIRFLHIPFKHADDKKTEKKTRRIIWLIAIITLLPSLYFGYNIVRQQRFENSANDFIKKEAVFANDYLLNKKISFRDNNIVLTFGGRKITEEEIAMLKKRLPAYGLEDTKIEIKQGFAYLTDNKSNEQINQMAGAIEVIDSNFKALQIKMDSLIIRDSLKQIKDSIKLKR